ncbi:unnamed protein product [Toxocara canis]|uniref:Col_cuticle_N domain-containing protein n=1 Tax=Toxocara canis TaxID=6265 RepID=A0A183VBS8_TOXCA|nr:unnamed protein product [Toxocara canis]
MVYITIMSVCLVLPMTVRQFCVSFVGRCATMIDAKLLLEIHRWISASSVIVFALTTLIAMTMVSKAMGGQIYPDIAIMLESPAQTCVF